MTEKDQKTQETLSTPTPPSENAPSYSDPPPTYTPPVPRTSTRSKVLDTLKKPFAPLLPTAAAEHKKQEEERPPALQEAIDRMEARKALTIRKMEEEGKDTSVLSGKRVDQVRNPLRLLGESGVVIQ
ncbi:hypothetical protein DM02DRAFT_658870 [Periconia macrospinosa]|uniref:Uncharacterized protein n=1 Tax=Periconia macrospinosa TaxID=97972 RepID=A0A2V1DFB8_9PLEO|nr:hypothetical protein DM02DRAFT_658870 [Periconia macrospinosa]